MVLVLPGDVLEVVELPDNVLIVLELHDDVLVFLVLPSPCCYILSLFNLSLVSMLASLGTECSTFTEEGSIVYLLGIPSLTKCSTLFRGAYI